MNLGAGHLYTRPSDTVMALVLVSDTQLQARPVALPQSRIPILPGWASFDPIEPKRALICAVIAVADRRCVGDVFEG